MPSLCRFRSRDLARLALLVAGTTACGPKPVTTSATPAAGPSGTLARVYYWRAKAGKFAEYTEYITKFGEPIDYEAQRRGAFISITTYVASDTSSGWTHMRIFVLRDSAQLAGLSAALDAAGAAIEPDSAKRRARSAYGATLRDAVGSATYRVLP